MKLSIALSIPSAAVSTVASECDTLDIGSGPYGVGYSNAESSITTPVFGLPNFVPADENRPIAGLPGLSPNGGIPFDVYYPTDATSGDPAAFTVQDIPIFLKGAFAGPAISTAESCWPLVIQSHGSGSIPTGQYELSVALASQGYVVITPAHIGDVLGFSTDFSTDLEAYYHVAKSRVLDIKSFLNYILYISPLKDFICHDQIAAIGVSFGAFTALAAANGYTTPSSEKLVADERIGAVVAMAPFTILFPGSPFNLAEAFRGTALTDLVGSDVPTLMLAMEDDELTPILSDADPLWDTIQCTTEQTYRVDFAGAGHSSPSSACDIIEQFETTFATILGGFGIDAVANGGVAGVCANINPAITPPDLVDACSIYFSQLTTKVSAGCMSEATQAEVCVFFGAIAAGLAQQGVLPADCPPATLDPTKIYVCSAFGALLQGGDPSRSFLDPAVCSGLTLPTLSGDDAVEITNTYVVSYLQTVFERDDDECFEEALEEEYAEEMALPVVEATLFLEDSVEDECDVSSEDV